MSVKNNGSWCEKHNQYARTKFDCPHCELDELRERVAWMLECEDTQIWVMSDCPLPSDDNWSEICESYIAARKSVEELL